MKDFPRIITLLFFLIFCHGYHIELWGKGHWSDLVHHDKDLLDANASRKRYSVLVMYKEECKHKVQQMNLNNRAWPDSRFFLALSYNIDFVPTKVWYDYDDSEMANDFGYTSCPTALFLPRNTSRSVVRWEENESFEKWVSDQLTMDVIFSNNLDHHVQIYKMADVDEDVLLGECGRDAETVINVKIGDKITAKKGRLPVFRTVIDSKETVEITSGQDRVRKGEVFQQCDRDEKLEKNRLWSTRRRHLNNIKGPPVMPKWTPIGFTKRKLPNIVRDRLKEYWLKNRHKKTRESFSKDGTQLNVNEVQTYLLMLPQAEKAFVTRHLQPILEEISGEKLKYSTLYGLREYRKGAVIKSHTDRVETHIISALIHVYHEPEDAQWEVEVTGFDGKRYRIVDHEGEYIYYESSKLIHGRPDPFTYDSWVNCFLHFRPVTWEGYTFSRDNVLHTPEVKVPIVDGIYG